MKKKIMILGASELQIPAIECANEMGIETIVLDYDENAIGKKMCSHFFCVSTLDYERVFEIAKKERIDGIMTICSDRPIPIIAKVAEQLNLCSISYDTAMMATDKGLMRKALLEKGVPIPLFFVCNNFAEFQFAVERINGRCIVKPSNNSGSRGIHICEHKDDIKSIYEYSSQYSTNNCVLVEEYMEGPEVSVEVFVDNKVVYVIQITDKITTGIPYFVEMGHTQPSALSHDIQSEIRKVTKQAIEALNINNGPAHVELKITSSGVKIVEVGARLGGDHITTDLVLLSTGIDMVQLAVKSALGEEIKISKSSNKASAIRYFNKSIDYNDQLIKKITYKFHIESRKIKEIRSSNDRQGYYIINGNDLSDIDEKLKKLGQLFAKECYNE